MSGMELDSLNKRGFRCEGVDRISQLPDEIISHILSFLPLKEAVATSILSPRWSNSWKYTPNLVFVNNRFDPMINIPIVMPPSDGPEALDIERSLKNVEWVNSVLNSYKALSLKQFTISFYVHPMSFHQVSKWIQFAFSRRVESLKLDIENFHSVLDVDMLSGIQSSDCNFLKELTLEDLNVSGEAIEFLLRNCSVLEGLIMNADLTSDLVVGGTLKYLDTFSPRRDGIFIKVCAPNLTRLLGFNYDLKKLLLEDVPNLVEASIGLYEDALLHIAKAAAKLEVLTISLDQPKAFAVPQMPKLKKLVVDYLSVKKKYMLPITRLLEASPCLEEFKLEISDLRKYYNGNYYYGNSSIRKAILKVPELGGFPHNHLKVFEFVGFCDKAAGHVELVRYIGNNCVGLEEIVITPISASVARQFQLRHSSEYMKRDILAKEVNVVAEEREALEMKKSTEEVLAGKLPDRIKLLVN